MSSQGLSIAANLAVAALIMTGWIEVWHLAPDDDLQAAVVLNTATLNIGQAAGPVIGGVVIGQFGLAPAFVVQALMIICAGLLISRIEAPPEPARSKQSWRESTREGLGYVVRHRLLGFLLLISLAPMIFIQPFRGAVPAITVQQLMADATVTGLLMAVLGLGAVISVLALASTPPATHPWRRIVSSAMISAVALGVFALSGQLLISAVALFVLGLAQASNRTLIQSLLLSETEDSLCGRVSSLWVVNRGTMPLGSFLLAGLATWWGVSIGLAVMGAVSLLATVIIALWARRLWSST